jgi:hypothetical protein
MQSFRDLNEGLEKKAPLLAINEIKAKNTITKPCILFYDNMAHNRWCVRDVLSKFLGGVYE